jgi:WhiB family redox-sensing transcriptional regulator
VSIYFDQPEDDQWMRQAACRADGVDPEWFHPAQDKGPSLSKARTVCGRCFVQDACLKYALAMEGGQTEKTRGGVYAGTTGQQRYQLYQRTRMRARRAREDAA